MHARRPGFFAAVLAAVLLVGGCVSPLSGGRDEAKLVESGRYRIVEGLDVPAVRDVEGCGAQALAAILAFEDASLDATGLAEALPWHGKGATPVDLLLEARQRGFSASIARGSWDALDENVRQGRPLLVMFDAAPALWGSASGIQVSHIMHWSVVSGVAADGSAVLLAARRDRHHVVGRDDFMKRWARSDFCMIVVVSSPFGRAGEVTGWRACGESGG